MNESAVQPSLAGRVATAVGAIMRLLVMTATSVLAVVWALATFLGLPDVVEADQGTDRPNFEPGRYLGRKA